MGDEINFLLTGDKKYVNQIIVTMTSIIENTPNSKLSFHIFEGGMNGDDVNKLKKIECNPNVSLSIYPMESYEHHFKNLCPEKSYNMHISKAGNYRLLMTEILPKHVKKCFYVDSDLIVDTNLTSIYNSLESDELALVVSEIAAMEYREEMLKHWYGWEEFAEFVKNPIKHPHFNDGFFLLNVEYARSVDIFQKILDFIEQHDYIPYTDQDILNAVLGQGRFGKIRLLPPHYNVFWNTDHYRTFRRSCYTSDMIADAFKNPKIVHYCGFWKPWDYGAWHHYDLWWKYAQKSIVADDFDSKKYELSKIIHEGMKYHYGWGVEKDQNKSLYYFMMGIKQGAVLATAYTIDAAIELNENNVIDELIPCASELAEKGNGDCAVRLAQLYRDGRGVEINLFTSIYWYRKAIDLKVIWCKPEYFDVLKKINDEYQKEMFDVATSGADGGNATSMVQLGRCYRDGIGTNIDNNNALVWLKKGVENGSGWANDEFIRLNNKKG